MLNYFLALIALFAAFNANAAIDQIYNWNGLEFVRSGNAHHVHPASPESTRLRGGWVLEISDVEPKVTGKHDLPYQHKGGALAKINVATKVNKSAIAGKAADAVKAAIQKGGSNPYLTVAAIGCSVFCDALIGWGVDKLKTNEDGTFSALVPDPAVHPDQSDGYIYHRDGISGLSIYSACNSYISYTNSRITDGWYYTYRGSSPTSAGNPGAGSCFVYQHRPSGDVYSHTGWQMTKSAGSSCPSGSPVVNGVCNGEAKIEKPLGRVFEDNIVNMPWGPVQVSVVKALIQNGHNVFTDGTDTTITGPDSVPLNTSKSSWPVNVLPGTTTPAPAGHTGPTDSGTQTTTTTTTAKNTFSPSGSSSGGSGSSGGPASLGSMNTTQQTTTTTTITNNITNNTSTSVTNNVTETDDAPKEEEKDFCEKNPDALACAELDTPEEEIPRRTLEITFEPEDLGLGRGTCPADRQMGEHTFSYQPTCDILATYGYPLTILLASFSALIIIFVGKTEV